MTPPSDASRKANARQTGRQMQKPGTFNDTTVTEPKTAHIDQPAGLSRESQRGSSGSELHVDVAALNRMVTGGGS